MREIKINSGGIEYDDRPKPATEPTMNSQTKQHDDARKPHGADGTCETGDCGPEPQIKTPVTYKTHSDESGLIDFEMFYDSDGVMIEPDEIIAALNRPAPAGEWHPFKGPAGGPHILCEVCGVPFETHTGHYAVKQKVDGDMLERAAHCLDNRLTGSQAVICLDVMQDFATAELQRPQATLNRKDTGAATYSDQKRKGLFKGTALDYVLMRADKHEKIYGDKKQADHLRRLVAEAKSLAAAYEADKARLAVAVEALEHYAKHTRWACVQHSSFECAKCSLQIYHYGNNNGFEVAQSALKLIGGGEGER